MADIAAAALIRESASRSKLAPSPDGHRGIPYGAKGKASKLPPAKPRRPHNLQTDFSPSLRLEVCVHCEPSEEQEELP